MTGGEDRRTTSVKLLWDLVFVFAVTQVSTLLARDLSWTWLTRERLRGLQEVAVAHFAERYGLFVIICLGESIVAIGVGADGRPIDAQLVLAAACGLLITVGLWWTYFDRLAAAAEEHLRHHDGSRHLSDGGRGRPAGLDRSPPASPW
jgi:low temperature requirement protein LtrA